MRFSSFLYSIAFIYTLVIGGSFLTSASFTDTSSHSYSTAIDYLQNKGVINGYSDGSFSPNSTINRAEFTKIIIGSVSTETDRNNCMADYFSQFSDVAKTDWFAPYICVAKNRNIIKGYSDGSFKPASSINFTEAAKIIANVYGSNFSSSDIWYAPYVEYLDEKNAIPLSISSLNKSITRAEMSEIVWRIDADKTEELSLLYQNDRLLNIKIPTATSSGITADQRRLYMKICRSRSSYQKFDVCMQQMILNGMK